MNKLTKQLLSLGLSAVTVAGMVTPVLADDEVPTTTESEATEVTDQPVDAVDQPTEEVADQQTDVEEEPKEDVVEPSQDVQQESLPGDFSTTKEYVINVYKDGEKSIERFDLDSTLSDDAVKEYIKNSCIPQWYELSTGKGAAGGEGIVKISDNEWDLYLTSRMNNSSVPKKTVTLNIIYLYEDKKTETKSVEVIDEETFDVFDYLLNN